MKDYWFSEAGIRFERIPGSRYEKAKKILDKIFWCFLLIAALYFIGHLIIALCIA